VEVREAGYQPDHAAAGAGRGDRGGGPRGTCQKWEEGFYNAYAHMAEEDLDLVVFLGDYTYEYGIDPATGGVRGVQLPPEYAEETVTLDQFRLRHALYKTDGDLQRAHARFPFVVTWDDHEVDNDYTGDIPEDGTPPEVFLRRRPQGLCPLRGRAGPPARRPALRRAGGTPGDRDVRQLRRRGRPPRRGAGLTPRSTLQIPSPSARSWSTRTPVSQLW
jgi:PhoD-like phosphatase